MTPSGPRPIAQLAMSGPSPPSMIRNENGLLWLRVRRHHRARRRGLRRGGEARVAAEVKLPLLLARVERPVREHAAVAERLKIVVPSTIFLILFLLYANTKSLAKT